MECPNCGHQNSETSSYCSECAAQLTDSWNAAETKLKPLDIERRVLRWFLGIVLSVTFVFLILLLPTALVVAIYDSVAGHRLLAGLGYVLAFEGGSIAFVAAFELFQIPEKMAMTRGATISPIVFFNTIFTPLRSAMLSTPRTYYDHSIVVISASFLTFLVGLAIID